MEFGARMPGGKGKKKKINGGRESGMWWNSCADPGWVCALVLDRGSIAIARRCGTVSRGSVSSVLPIATQIEICTT